MAECGFFTTETRRHREKELLRAMIKLDQFLKLTGVAATGGQAKVMIQGGEVEVNGELETRRKRQLAEGDKVTVDGQTFEVNYDELNAD